MRQAQEALRGKWVLPILTFLFYAIVVGVLQGKPDKEFHPTSLISMLISGPLSVGLSTFSLAISRNQEARFEQIFEGFKIFGKALGAYLVMLFFIILWSILLIIPGIIAAISYGLTYFILVDEPTIGAIEAVEKSKAMMAGFKWKFFCLGLRLFGLALLCVLTLGIGFLWFMPYAYVVTAKFYDDVKADYLDRQSVS